MAQVQRPVKPDAKRYLTQTMKEDKQVSDEEWMAQSEEKNQSPGKTLEYLPGGEKQNELFKDLGRWRAEVQANN